jgi:dsRNA-specific ribonuclease
MENEAMLKKVTQDEDVCVTDEGMVFNPFNNLNKEITLSEVQSILKEYGVVPTVHNLSLYKRAFVHRSYTKRPHFENMQHNIILVDKPFDTLPLSSKSNERL